MKKMNANKNKKNRLNSILVLHKFSIIILFFVTICMIRVIYKIHACFGNLLDEYVVMQLVWISQLVWNGYPMEDDGLNSL